jgi:isoleucyl-tRNA synthetase
VTDRIAIDYQASERIATAIAHYGDWIRNETLALELQEAEQPTGEAVETFRIGEEELTVGVRRV